VTTDRDDIAAIVRSLRNHGSTGAPDPSVEPHGPWTMATFGRLGYNLRFSDIQAAVGVAQMAKLDGLLTERRRWARRYTELLHTLANDIALPSDGDVEGHTYQSYVVRLRDGGRLRRNSVMQSLADAKIETRPGTHAVHRLDYYRNKYGISADAYPNAALAEDTTITLPLFPGMSNGDQEFVAEQLATALKRGLAQVAVA